MTDSTTQKVEVTSLIGKAVRITKPGIAFNQEGVVKQCNVGVRHHHGEYEIAFMNGYMSSDFNLGEFEVIDTPAAPVIPQPLSQLEAAIETLQFVKDELELIPAPIEDTRFATETINLVYQSVIDMLEELRAAS